MPDIQISNARRVVFTAMALVVFWVAAWEAYVMGWSRGTNWTLGLDFSLDSLLAPLLREIADRWYVAAPCLAVGPSLFLSIATSNNPFIRPTRWSLGSTAVFVVSLTIVDFIGSHAERTLSESNFGYMPEVWGGPAPAVKFALRFGEFAPWSQLLIPITLTTAFVIYGAWRSAVRAAARRMMAT